MAKAGASKSLDLGKLQDEVENSTRALKAASTTLVKAQEAWTNAEKNYHAAQKTLKAGVEQLYQATKVV